MAKLLLAALFCLAAHAAAAAEPSRPPEQGFGCVWKPFESKEQGIHLLVQDCTDPKIHYEFTVKDGWLEEAVKTKPFGRLIDPKEVARACAYLCSDESGLMTGSNIDFDQNVVGTADPPLEP